MMDAKAYLVSTRCAVMHQGRATSRNAIVATGPVHAAQRAETTFPRSAWERGRA